MNVEQQLLSGVFAWNFWLGLNNGITIVKNQVSPTFIASCSPKRPLVGVVSLMPRCFTSPNRIEAMTVAMCATRPLHALMLSNLCSLRQKENTSTNRMSRLSQKIGTYGNLTSDFLSKSNISSLFFPGLCWRRCNFSHSGRRLTCQLISSQDHTPEEALGSQKTHGKKPSKNFQRAPHRSALRFIRP